MGRIVIDQNGIDDLRRFRDWPNVTLSPGPVAARYQSTPTQQGTQKRKDGR